MTIGNSIYEGLIREGINTPNLIETFNNLDKTNQKNIWRNLNKYKNVMLMADRKKVFNFFDNPDNMLWNSPGSVDDEIHNNLDVLKKDRTIHDYLSKKTSLLNWSEKQWDFFHQYSYDIRFYKEFLFFYGNRKNSLEWLEVIKNVKEKNKTQSISEIAFYILNGENISNWNIIIEEIKNCSEEIKVKFLKGILKTEDQFQSRNKMNLVIEVIVKKLSEQNKEWFILESLNKPIMKDSFDFFDIYLNEAAINLFSKIKNSDCYLLKNHKKSINKLEETSFSAYIWMNKYNPSATLINTIVIKWLRKSQNDLTYIKLEGIQLTSNKKGIKKTLFDTIYNLFIEEKRLVYKIPFNLYGYLVLHCIYRYQFDMLAHMINGLKYESKEFKKYVYNNILTPQNLEQLKMIDDKKIEVRLKDHQNILKEQLQEYQSQVFSMILDEELENKENNNKRVKL